MPDLDPNLRLVTISEAARRIHLDPRTTLKIIEQAGLRLVTSGEGQSRRLYVSLADLESIILCNRAEDRARSLPQGAGGRL